MGFRRAAILGNVDDCVFVGVFKGCKFDDLQRSFRRSLRRVGSGCALNGQTALRTLLNDMREFMREEVVAELCSGLILATGEEDVATDSKGVGVELAAE